MPRYRNYRQIQVVIEAYLVALVHSNHCNVYWSKLRVERGGGRVGEGARGEGWWNVLHVFMLGMSLVA